MHVQVCKEKSKCYRQWLWVRQTGSHCQSWLIVLLLRTEGLLLLLHDDHQVEEEGAEAPSDPLVVFSIFPSVLFSPYHHYCCRCLAVTAAVTCTGITFTVAHCQHTHTQAQTHRHRHTLNCDEWTLYLLSFALSTFTHYVRTVAKWVCEWALESNEREQWKRKEREGALTWVKTYFSQLVSQSMYSYVRTNWLWLCSHSAPQHTLHI